MAAKSRLDPYTVAINQTMATSFTQTKPTNIQGIDNVAYQITWAGASVVGRFIVEATNDDVASLNVTPSWTQLVPDAGDAVPEDSGSITLTLTDVPYWNMRFRYVATSGSGFFTVRVSGKGK